MGLHQSPLFLKNICKTAGLCNKDRARGPAAPLNISEGASGPGLGYDRQGGQGRAAGGATPRRDRGQHPASGLHLDPDLWDSSPPHSDDILHRERQVGGGVVGIGEQS